MGIQNCVQVIPGVSEVREEEKYLVWLIPLITWRFWLGLSVLSHQSVSKSWGREVDQIEGPTLKSILNGIKGPRFGVKLGFRSLIRCVIRYITPLSII